MGKNMFGLRISCVFLFLWLTFPAGKCCAQLEEGKLGSIFCTYANRNMFSMVAQAQRNGVFVDILSCNGQGVCNNSFPLQYVQQFNTFTQPYGYQLNLTILNVTRTEPVYRCRINGGLIQVDCKPDIYVKPSVPTCEAPYESTDHRIALTCSTDRIFPEARCEFYHQEGYIQGPLNASVVDEIYPSPISPDDLRVVCTLLIDPRNLTPRLLPMRSVFYPLAANYTQDQGAISVEWTIINITAPTVSLGSDCPKNYTAPGSKATCTCQLSSPGFPRGQAQWYDKFNSPVGTNNAQNGSSVLELETNAADSTHKFECRADTVLSVAKAALVYSPLIAYGPSLILIETEGDTFDLCPSKSLVIPIICKVDHSQINPHPLFTIKIDDNAQVELKEGQLISTYYQYTYYFTPSSGGSYRVTCQVQNSAISTLGLSKNTMVTVREPPQSAPVLITSISQPGSGIVNVTGMKELDVTCQADGGSPRVDKVTLSCGPNKAESTNWIATLRVQITDSLTEQRCYCSAVHVTGCYDKQAQLILRQGDVHPDDNGNDLALKVGVGVGVSALIIIVVIVVLVVVCWVKKRKPSPGPNRDYDYPIVYSTETDRQTCGDFMNFNTAPPYGGYSVGSSNTYATVGDTDSARFPLPRDDYITPA